MTISLCSLLHALTVVQHCFTGADGGWDVFKNIDLSGEPLIEQLRNDFGSRPDQPMPLLEYQNRILELMNYRREYQDYWIATSNYSGTGEAHHLRCSLSSLIFKLRSSSRCCDSPGCSACRSNSWKMVSLQWVYTC